MDKLLTFSDKHVDILNSFISKYKNSKNTEFEIRFGSFKYDKVNKKSTFTNTNALDFYYNLEEKLISMGVEKRCVITTDSIYTLNDKTMIRTSELGILEKTSIRKYNVFDYDFRIALNTEQVKKELPNVAGLIPFSRTKNRTSFTLGSFRIDMTIIKDLFFEIELEIIDKNITLESLTRMIYFILKIKQDNIIITSSMEEYSAINHYTSLVKSRNFIGAQPETLHRSQLTILYEQDYGITDKIDGKRCLLKTNDNNTVYFIDTNLKAFKTDLLCNTPNCILDAEIFTNNDNVVHFYIFDIIIYNNNDLRGNQQYPLIKRLELIKNITFNISDFYKTFIKTYYFNNIFVACETIMSNPTLYNKDGLIFVPINDPYPLSKKWKNLLKWKPAELNTIDFYSIQISKGVWELYVYDKDKDNVGNKKNTTDINILFKCPEHLSTKTFTAYFDDDRYKSNTVIEYSWINLQWVPLRTRWDKTLSKKGNFIDIALDIWKSIMYPVDFETLIKFTKKPKQLYFKNMRFLHNRIKEIFYNKYTNKTNSCLELCSGNGGDVNKWYFNKIKRVDCYDTTITELSKRITNNTNTIINATILDLYSSNASDIIQKNCSGIKYNNIICHFAIHYFLKSEEILDNFIKIISDNIDQNGKFITTFIDSRLLENLFNNQDEVSYIDYATNEILYLLKQDSNNKCSPFGNALDVYLNGDNYLSKVSHEYIVDSQHLIYKMALAGFKVEELVMFKDLNDNTNLEPFEQDISYLNTCIVFSKNNNNTHDVPIKIPKVIHQKDYILVELHTLYNLIDFINTCTRKYIYKANFTNKPINKTIINTFYNQCIFIDSLDSLESLPSECLDSLYFYTEHEQIYNVLLKHKSDSFIVEPEPSPIMIDESDPNDLDDPDDTVQMIDESTVDYNSLTIKEIKPLLKQYNLKLSGNKKEMLDRLIKSLQI